MNDINSPLISIIVPIYNVERYLEECVDSILNQSYGNIEVLLINDGSPDNSPQIADSYAEIDHRVKVFHKENEGVSTARNFGIEVSNGEYVVFVDSDDYLSRDFVEYMMKIVKLTNADFCLSKNIFTSTEFTQIDSDLIQNYTNEDATCMLLYPGITIGSWNKIFKRSFLNENNIKFPTTFFMGEGLNFITTVSQLANSIGVGHKKVYFYRTNNLESATSKFNINKLINAFEAIYNIRKNLILESPKVIDALNFHLWDTNLYALEKIISSSSVGKYPEYYKEYTQHLRNNSFHVFIKSKVSFFQKMKVFFVWINPKLATKMLLYIKGLKA